MKLLFAALLVFTACSSNPQHARYAEEKNVAKSAMISQFTESPDEVRRAARAALDQLNHESDPPVPSFVSGSDNSLSSAWVYEISKTKYVEYKENEKPQRKPLRVRRRYTYLITPSLSGSMVQMGAEEEVMKLNLKTGEETGWESSSTDTTVFEQMKKILVERLREMKN